jgi:ubiquinone/menaquinone biosynthesis C-methylase UbiE
MQHAGRALIDPFKIFEKIELRKGMRVADMGCGRTGHFVFPASRIVGETGVVYAVDILKEVLESINSWIKSEGMHNVQTIWSDIEIFEKTPIPPNSLDVCFFMNTMSAVKDKSSAIKEAHRLLKQGGKVVVIDWIKKLGTLGPHSDLVASPEKISETARLFGLTEVANTPASEYHYCLIFKK